MEGEVLATGTHQELLKNSKEYQQIYNSQMSTT
jgi:ATP-binding cassette subfamily B protein